MKDRHTALNQMNIIMHHNFGFSLFLATCLFGKFKNNCEANTDLIRVVEMGVRRMLFVQ